MMELSDLLPNFKKDIINDIARQLDSMQAGRKKEEANAMLAKFFSHCKEKKRNCRCKTIASMDTNLIPIEFKAINEENGEFFYVSQRCPWA